MEGNIIARQNVESRDKSSYERVASEGYETVKSVNEAIELIEECEKTMN